MPGFVAINCPRSRLNGMSELSATAEASSESGKYAPNKIKKLCGKFL